MLVVAVLVHHANLRRALLGWDTYATLAASRVASASDLLGTFTERLMDGRLAFGDFYRPVGNAFVAFDVAVWGLEPFGHQLTSTLVFAAACALTAVVVRQRQRSPGVLPAAWAAAMVVLHPAALSILPVVARRTETLMILFVLAALAAAGRAGWSRGRRGLAAAACALLAVGSKEPGLVVLPLLFVDRLIAGETTGSSDAARGGLPPRVAGALRFVGPSLGAVALFGLARTVVLGGLGGYFEPPETPYPLRLLAHAPAYLAMVTTTGALGGAGPASGLASVITLVSTGAVAAGCLLLARVGGRPREWGGLALPTLGLVWIAFQLALASTAAKPEPRYAEGLVVGLALVVAGLVDRGLVLGAAARASSNLPSATAWALLALACVITGPALAGAPLWHGHPALEEASRVQAAELAALEARIAAVPPGDRRERVRLTKLRPIFDPGVDHAWMLSPWSLEAWLELRFPDRHLVVQRDELVRPERSAWHLVVVESADEPVGSM